MNFLLNECVEKLKSDVNVLDKDESNKIFQSFESLLPFTFYGRIDWEKKSEYIEVLDYDSLVKFFDKKTRCYILWNNSSLPVLETSFSNFVEGIDDVLAVSYDTWVHLYNDKNIIEFYHDGDIRIVSVSVLM